MMKHNRCFPLHLGGENNETIIIIKGTQSPGVREGLREPKVERFFENS